MAAWAERPRGFGSENPKQLPSHFTWGFSPSLLALLIVFSHLMESLHFLVQVKIRGHSLGHLVKVPFGVTELDLKK